MVLKMVLKKFDPGVFIFTTEPGAKETAARYPCRIQTFPNEAIRFVLNFAG